MIPLSKIKIVYTCGGTGGHIYPAIAVAQELEGRAEAMFIGSIDREDIHILPKYGYNAVRIVASNRNIWKIIKGFSQSRKALKKYRPSAVVSTGGYLTFSVVIAAWTCGIPIFILEQNAVIGRVNKWLARFANKVFVSFKETLTSVPKGKGVYLGNPVRKNFPREPDVVKQLSKIKSERVLLIFGGSQGARALNQFIEVSAKKWIERGWELIQITGRKNGQEWIEKSKEVEGWHVMSYVEDMASLYRIASVVLSRAGATTIAELVAFQKPAYLIPYPYAKDNHQEKNAQAFVEMGPGAWCQESDMSFEPIYEKVAQLMTGEWGEIQSAREQIANAIIDPL